MTRAALFCLGATLWVAGCGSSSEPTLLSGDDLLRVDPRIATLLVPCGPPKNRFYDRDTSDMLPILVEKLTDGSQDPLKRAKEELGAIGSPAVVPLRRLYDRHSAQMFEAPYLENVLDVGGLSEAPEMRELLLLGLRHRQESVRKRALTSLLTGHLQPGDFEPILENHIRGLEPEPMKQTFAKALHQADPERAEALYLEWIRTGENKSLWSLALPELGSSEDPETAARCAELFEEVPPALRAWVAAPAARAGDSRALAFLRAELSQPDGARLALTLQAIGAAELFDELGPIFTGGEQPGALAAALGVLGQAETWKPEYFEWARTLLEHSSPEVRTYALRSLVHFGDVAATNRALSQLHGGTRALQDALVALMTRMPDEPELSARVLSELETRYELESHRPLSQRLASLKGIGQVPLAAAARKLREIALETEGLELESLRAHEWILIQAANTGQGGRRYLFEQLASEEHPLRRIDLIWSVTAFRDDLAREALLELVAQEESSPYERLYLAARLANVGPSTVAAPLLKRLSYELETEEVRIALQCLLWEWY